MAKTKPTKVCAKCNNRNTLLLGSDMYFCNNKDCEYFELFPKGINALKKEKTKQNSDSVTPREIANMVKCTDVIKFLKSQYHWKKVKNAKIIFERIKDAPKRKHKDSNEFIEVTKTIEEGETWYITSTNKYSLSFRKWNEVANIPVAYETFLEYNLYEILAHVIYEISWYGMEEDMVKTGKEIFKKCDKIRKEIIEGKSRTFTNVE